MTDPFIYRPPTLATAACYAHLRALEAAAADTLRKEAGPVCEPNALMVGAGSNATPADFAAVNAACKALYDGILAVCPPSADRDRAEADARLARMRANEAMTQARGPGDCSAPARILDSAIAALRDARMWACASIALADEAALPPTERGAGGFGSTGTGPDDDRARLEARVRALEAEVSEARAEAAQWAAELDALRGAE